MPARCEHGYHVVSFLGDGRKKSFSGFDEIEPGVFKRVLRKGCECMNGENVKVLGRWTDIQGVEHCDPEDPKVPRRFVSGATRDSSEGKLDYEGFFSPFVLRRRAEYMHKHRVQADGALRDSDNWQKGMPISEYGKSLLRHAMEFWRWLRGEKSSDPEEALCAVMFNAEGALLELLKRREATQ